MLTSPAPRASRRPPRHIGARIAPRRDGPAGPVHTLHPGDVAIAGAGERFETLLGSCVAIVLTDPRRTVGAMCHLVHVPHARPAAEDSAATPRGAYADIALDALFTLLQERAINPRLCQAWVYGGGNMFPALGLAPGEAVGDDNARWALDTLATEGIRVLGVDVGGACYRRLAWTVGPGAPQVAAVAV